MKKKFYTDKDVNAWVHGIMRDMAKMISVLIMW